MNEPEAAHIPVLLEEILTHLQPGKSGRFVDGTLGLGGHSLALLQTHPHIEILAIDRDAAALEAATKRLSEYSSRVHFFQGSYAEMPAFAKTLGWTEVDGILLDLGLSSMQLDTPGRGFSHSVDGPLDMRFDRRNRTTASTILNEATVTELTHILRDYGDEPRARQIAQALTARRAERPWERTADLAEFLRPLAHPNPAKKHQMLARVFQGLRIAVNEELRQVEEGLQHAIKLLAPGGTLAIISFHSLEDRIVKQAFKEASLSWIQKPEHPMGGYDVTPTLELVTKKPIRPTDEEIARNSRAAPSRLRVARKYRPPSYD